MSYDVIIIGAGVVGCAIARELSRYQLKVLVLDKESDVARGASGRNSGVVHSGIQVPAGSLKARLNIVGSKLFPQLCRQLGVPYRRVGKLIVAQCEEELDTLLRMKQAGGATGIADLQLLDTRGLKRMEPNINGLAALYSPTDAITSPYTLNIALAENAMQNGVEIKLNSQVVNINNSNNGFNIETGNCSYTASYVVNSAGIWADKVARMVGITGYCIYPWRGEYWVMDKQRSGLIGSMVYPVPKAGAGGLGIHLTPTISGNILLGPSAEYIKEREDYRTTEPVLDRLYQEARQLLPAVEPNDFIAGYAGIRCKLSSPASEEFMDFVIREEPQLKGFINLVGIESPGLSAAPAIARQVVGIIGQGLKLAPDPDFNPDRSPTVRFEDMPLEQKAALIKNDPDSGELVCRCERVTRREVLAAIQNPLGAKSISAIKYRCRAGMGRCQGGYCLPRLVDILETHTDEEITLHGPGSPLFIGSTKGLLK
jgi:glycerol-3-phosphate dehydrogenase